MQHIASLESTAPVEAFHPAPVMITESFRELTGFATGLTPVSGSIIRQQGRPIVLYHWPDADCRRRQSENCDSDPSCELEHILQIDGLGDLKPLLRAAAVAGDQLSAGLLADMLDMDAERLTTPLAWLARHGILAGGPAHAAATSYQFRDDAFRKSAYETVAPRDRLRLHRKAADALRTNALLRDACPSDQIAHHHVKTSNGRQSKRWLSKAGWHAIARSEPDRAVMYLKQALALDGKDRASSPADRALLQLIGVQLAITKGNGNDDVFRACQRSIELAGEASTLVWGQEFRSLWLAQSCHLVKGEIRAALTIGNLLQLYLRRQSGRPNSALGMPILVDRMQGLALMLSGDLNAARALYQSVLSAYNMERHAILRFAYGSDQDAVTLAHCAWLETLAGDCDASARATRRARELCEQMAHPHTSAHVTSVLALAALERGAAEEAEFAAQETRTLAIEHGFAYWMAWAEIVLSAARTHRSAAASHAALEPALAAYKATGAEQFCPAAYAFLSRAALDAGNTDAALLHADAGLALAERGGALLYRPQLLLQRALARSRSRAPGEADDDFEAAYAEAERSGAKLWVESVNASALQATTGQAQIKWQARYHDALN